MLSKFAYLILESGFKLKAGTDFSSPEEFHRIVAHENVQFSAAKNEARSSKNADENAKCLVVKELQLLRHHACSKIVNMSIRPCPNKIASKLEILDCSHSFYSEHKSEYQSKLSIDHSSCER